MSYDLEQELQIILTCTVLFLCSITQLMQKYCKYNILVVAFPVLTTIAMDSGIAIHS